MRKILSFILALAICLSLCACGSSGGAGSTNGQSNSTQQSSQKADKPKKIGSKVQSITLGEEVALNFVKMTFDSVEVGYSVGGSGFSTIAQDGMRCFSLAGTIENVGGSSLSVANINAEMTFNGEYTYKANATINDSKSYPVSVSPLAKAEYLIYAEIPETLLDMLSTCEVRFSLNDDFASIPKSSDTGDHVFAMELSEDVCKAALAAAEEARIFFEECPSMPKPENYAPLYQSSRTTSSRNGVVSSTKYSFSVSPGRNDNITDIYTSYIAKIQQLGFIVNSDTGSSCEIFSGETRLALVSVGNGTIQFELFPGNEALPSPASTVTPKAAPTIEIGQTVATSDYEFTLNKVELSYEILPPNTNGVYSSYPAESGKVFVHVEASVKNTMPRDIRISELFSTSVLYDGKYPYTGFTIVNDGDNDFDWVSSYIAATPLETCIAHGVVECPAEVDTSGKSIKVQLSLGNAVYEYSLR